jgi:hypothetical protein
MPLKKGKVRFGGAISGSAKRRFWKALDQF